MRARSILLRAFGGAALVLGVVATPVSASGHTWYVARSGSGGGSCANPDFNTIQVAINAAGPGDTVTVCPGTYVGRITIASSAKDGLRLVSSVPHGATILVPTSGGVGGQISYLVRIRNADNVTVSGFNIQARGALPCVPTLAPLIIRKSDNTTITNNRIGLNGGTTGWHQPCGYFGGIGDNGTSSLIDGNRVTDFVDSGISTQGTGARITNNVIRYWHKDQVGNQGAYAGIAVGFGSDALVKGNTIAGLSSTAGPSGTPALGRGISVRDEDGATVSGNTVRYTINSIIVSGTNLRIRHNTINHSYGNGLWLSESSGANVRENSSLNSGTYDCIETDSTGANTWTGNVGNTSSPDGLCTPP